MSVSGSLRGICVMRTSACTLINQAITRRANTLPSITINLLHSWISIDTMFVLLIQICGAFINTRSLHGPQGRPAAQRSRSGRQAAVRASWNQVGTPTNPLSLEYQPSPLAAPGSVCGPQPSGTAHPLKERRRKHR